MLTLSLFSISLLNPRIDLIAIGFCGILIATFAVITDIILNARRINIVAKEIQPIAEVINYWNREEKTEFIVSYVLENGDPKSISNIINKLKDF